jgi:subtilisin family serine protease
LLALLVLLGAPPVLGSAAADRGEGRYIVVLRDDVRRPAALAARQAERYGLEVSHVYRHALKGYAATIPASRLAAVRSDPSVEFVSVDGAVRAFAQRVPTGVNRIQADASSTLAGNGSGTVETAVAVIDTGSGPHPDLRIAGGVNCSTGAVDDYADGNGHGTHVAGTIAALDNGVGVVGVAPGAPIYSVRVLDDAGAGTWGTVICGIDWVTGHAAELDIAVANMSLGGPGSDDGNCGNTNGDAAHRAICASVAAGVTYVVSAGNRRADIAGFAPAAYDEVLTVTAMADFNGRPGGRAAATCKVDVDDTSADFSNFTYPDSADAAHTVAAPGVCIRSTRKGGTYRMLSGTSMAAPHVAGTIALCIATGACTGTPGDVIARIRIDAAARPKWYGFIGDPHRPLTSGDTEPRTLYFGHLVFAGGY